MAAVRLSLLPIHFKFELPKLMDLSMQSVKLELLSISKQVLNLFEQVIVITVKVEL
jgi:hypothetical protein